MSDDQTFTETDVVCKEGLDYVFAVTITYNTDTGEIVSTDYTPVLSTQ